MIDGNNTEVSQGKSGIIFNIQRYSLHDGPGIRTLVFMKGCPLSCKWCSNPESQKRHPEIGFIEVDCVGADKCNARCVNVCTVGAITLSEEGKPNTDRKICNNCGKCAEACFYRARKIVGQSMSVEEVLAVVQRDKPFYRKSGGVTVGGGELTGQAEFVSEFLKQCKERWLNTAIETCGHCSWENLEQILKYVDTVYYDIKHMDPMKHKELTGVSNDVILSNAKKLISEYKDLEIIVRIPIIPWYTDSKENIKATAKFVAESGGKKVELLPYHRLGSSKYTQYGMEYEMKEIEPPNEKHVNSLRNIIESFGLKEMTGVM